MTIHNPITLFAELENGRLQHVWAKNPLMETYIKVTVEDHDAKQGDDEIGVISTFRIGRSNKESEITEIIIDIEGGGLDNITRTQASPSPINLFLYDYDSVGFEAISELVTDSAGDEMNAIVSQFAL